MAGAMFVLPESFNPAEFLTGSQLAQHWDDARYFVNLILLKTARGNVDRGELVRLKAEHLRQVMSFRTYAAVINALLAGGAVERSGYTVGVQSFGYRLADRYRRDRHVRVAVADPQMLHRLERFRAQAESDRQARMKPVHEALAIRQRRLSVDRNRAREILAGLAADRNPYDVQGILVEDIARGEFRLNVGRYGRVSNNITNLKRELRPALRADGKPLESVDVSCCQPGLLVALAQQHTGQERHGGARGRGAGRRQRGDDTAGSIYDVQLLAPPEDGIELYVELAESGRLYEYLLAEMAKRGISMERDELKRKFLSDVLAKRKVNKRGDEYPSLVEDTFRRLFPAVYDFVRKFNADGWEHENLIRELQRQESKLVIENVAARLVEDYPEMFLITLHDAIFTTPANLDRVEAAFEQAFDEVGFRLTLKRSK